MSRKLLSFILVLAMVMSMNVVTFADEDGTEITIVHTNDTHSRIDEGKYDGMGFAKIATKVEELRAQNPNLLLLDAGDTFHGQTIATLVEGESIVTIMNAMQYDAMTAGNHDFNYGQERLLELAEMANFPVMGGNVKKDGEPLLDEYIIKEIDGVKVGIFGLSTPETTYKTHPLNVIGLTFEDPAIQAQKMVDMLEGQVDVIVALGHLGVDESSTYTSEAVINSVDGIDVFIDGHSHTALEGGKMVGDTLLVQTGEYDKNLGIVNLMVKDGMVTAEASLFSKEAAADVTPNAAIVSVIDEVKAENEVITNVKVASTSVTLDGERGQVRAGETNLGNMIADAMIDVTGADVAITNGGGIRASINPGDITKGDVITVLPFGNYVMTKEIKGSDILAAIEHGIDSYPETKGAFPHISGMRVEFDPNQPAGSRIVKVMVGGEMLDPNAMYTLATNDFMAYGGDDYGMFADYPILGEFDGLDEVLIDYMAKVDPATVKVDGRMMAHEMKKAEAMTYTVMANDVLWKIAEKYDMTYQELAEYNNLDNPNMIYVGQELMVPAK
ncbi:5'-nucleotidase C-terminal domain-containing protein [Fusibacter sp. JL216-2]|uniref:5'-nucleotidase C-terminal domain-containing protein n=1 Tax=Fusibacter sp. JL216-2 TaxID=3071453 RepID=UPI003D328A53